jgi:hypothetical protein
VDTVVGHFFDFLCDIWVVVLCSRYLGSVKGEARNLLWAAYVEGEVGTEAFDELVVAFGGGCNNLIPRKLG